MLYDVFISHASEDKEAIARPLAEQLRARRVEVWFDEFSLSVGDSLRRSIDRGLAESRFGIVILSPSFISKQWPQWELDGLVARQISGEENLILPVWHDLARDQVLAFSPPLADRLAVDSSLGFEAVAEQLLRVIQPKGSTLAIARDLLIDEGMTPPVISDDWWLDIAGASESNAMEGGIQESMGWGRWGFPLPARSDSPYLRAARLARTALQTAWQDKANSIPITQLSHPDDVLDFISTQPGLEETCLESSSYLAVYAPQLVIPGFGGMFEAIFEERYLESIERDRSAAHATGRAPAPDEDYALRDTDLDRYESSHLACGFVQGNNVFNGPPCMYFSYVDYVAWFLSDASRWMPAGVRQALTHGIASWGVWPWNEFDVGREFGFVPNESTGTLADALRKAKSLENLRVSKASRLDAVTRLGFSARLLGLPEDGEILADALLGEPFLSDFFGSLAKRR